MIPRVLHQVWVGPLPVPGWAAVWRDMHPGWEYHLWRESDIVGLPRLVRRAWDDYIARGRWHGAANVARAAILHECGGVYVDVDSRPLRCWADAPFMWAGKGGPGLFAAYEPNVPDLPGRVANGCIGATVAHPAIDDWLRLMDRLVAHGRLEEPWQTTGGTSLTAALALHATCCDVRIMPARVLYPLDAHGRITPGTSEAWSDHYWATTNLLYEAA